MKIKLLISCIAMLFAATQTFAFDKLTVLMQRPVKVSSKVIHLYEGSHLGHYGFELLIEHSSSNFKFETEIMSDSLPDALKSLKKSVRWIEPYLFVSWDRGGGNTTRGYLDAVFMLDKGELRHIGEVHPDSFENGVFKDWYNKFELNQLTSHADSPLIKIVLEVKNGRFQVDLGKTWLENQEFINENEKIIEKNIESRSEIAGSLLFVAMLKKYCKKEKDIDLLMNIAKKELSKEDMKLFNDILAHVIPGELPEAAIPLKKY